MLKKIYFMGIKGVGQAPLAIIAKQAGIDVSGSDIKEEFITDKILKDENINFLIGFKRQNVRDFFSGVNQSECLFVATGAHGGFDNEESKAAREMGVRVISQGQALGEFMTGSPFGRADIEGIAATGAHGKTTVTAMIATVLKLANYDPSYSVGTSEIVPIGASGHCGSGRYFVAEADEYFSEPNYDPTPKFLYLKPSVILINNIDFDHPDVYRDLTAVKNAYLDFASNLPASGLLVINGDDENLRETASKVSRGPKIISFGTGRASDFVISDFKQSGFESSFMVSKQDTSLGKFELSIPGYHNAKNATGVIALLFELGVSIEKIQSGLKAYSGSKRRIEIIGKTRYGQILIDDYAHHPEEIRKSLQAIREAAPTKKLVTVFQFHTYSRTRALFSGFVSSFSDTSELILLRTFTSQRDETSEEDLDQKTVDAFHKLGRFVPLYSDQASVVEYIDKNFTDPDTVVITMGAGNVYKISEKLKVSAKGGSASG